MPAHIYQRPLMDQGSWNIPIRLVGSLGNYELGDEYEGRLQILNSVGPRKVRQIGGDLLPDGTSITIDENTAEVVISWPALYLIPETRNEYAASLKNSGFEETGGWSYGVGWNVTTDNAITGQYSAVYGDNNGYSDLNHVSKYKINRDRVLTAECRILQGASSKGNAGGCVRLNWWDIDGNQIGHVLGNFVMQGSNNAVATSRVRVTPDMYPENAYMVSIAGLGIRHRQNKRVWFDDFKWNHVVIDITEAVSPLDEYQLELEVEDVTGRTATWKGSIYDNSLWITSTLYPMYAEESLGIAGSFNHVEHGFGIIPQYDNVSLGASFKSIERRSIVVKFTVNDAESISLGASFKSIARQTILQKASADTESISLGATFKSIARQTHPHIYTDMELIQIGAVFKSITRTKP